MLQSQLFENRQKLANEDLPKIGEIEDNILYMKVTSVNDN